MCHRSRTSYLCQAFGFETSKIVPEAAPEPNSDDEEVQAVQQQHVAAEEEEELMSDNDQESSVDLRDDDEQELILFGNMVNVLIKEGEQFRVLSGPPVLNETLLRRTVAVRLVDIGWCAGLVVGQASSLSVKS